MALIDDLLNELKDRLQVTWDDEPTNSHLNRLLNRGQAYLNEICGTEFTFEETSPERELLMERCRYDWNNALSDFEGNFHSELSRLILQVAVDDFEAEGPQMALERIRETFNDGILSYGEYKTIRSESRKRLGKEFILKGTLHYHELSVRESDYLQFGSMGSTLDLKVKTPMPPFLKKIDKENLIVQIDGDDFSIIHTDRDNYYLYFLFAQGGW